MKAGFAEIDITPETFPVRTYFSTVDDILDPIFAHAAFFEVKSVKLLIISLDIVIIEHEYVLKIRKEVFAVTGVPEANIMVCATHNHACPAVIDRPWSAKDDEYIEFMIERVVRVAEKAVQAQKTSVQGVETGFEARVSFNRRFIMKNGTVITQPGNMGERNDILCQEGVIDPELGVMAFKSVDFGEITGIIVNFACHAVHHMGDISSGYPGVLYTKLREKFGEDCVILFLNGACGNIHHVDHTKPDYVDTKERMGSILAEHTIKLIEKMSFDDMAVMSCRDERLFVKYRDYSGLERNIDNMEKYNVFSGLIERNWYKYSLDKLKVLHSKADGENVIIQTIQLGDVLLAMVPAEYFCENAFYIKEKSSFEKTFVVTLANGWMGYIPHPEAFKRQGGHETTWCVSSKMDAKAGRDIANRILDMIN